MNDRLPIRDRTLVLRILVPGLEARLRDKVKESEDEYLAQNQPNQTQLQQSNGNGPNNNRTLSTIVNRGGGTTSGGGSGTGSGGGGDTTAVGKDRILDLEGVTCEPTLERNRTLWNFHCDGATYPAKLVNLPCPVELHKTHDHAAYYKCVDVAQMLIVYEDDIALTEADEKPSDGYPSYYHSGLTPPTKRVVERRFSAREHKAQPPPRLAVTEVESELLTLMDKLAKDEKTKRNKVPTLTSANKILDDIVEEIVDYEPWMDDNGRQLGGVEFDTDDPLCKAHPEVWLTPDQIRQLKDAELEEHRKIQDLALKEEMKRREKKEEEAKNKSNKKNNNNTSSTTVVGKDKPPKNTKKKNNNPPVVDTNSTTNVAAAAAAIAVDAAALENDDVMQAAMNFGNDDNFDDFDGFDFDDEDGANFGNWDE